VIADSRINITPVDFSQLSPWKLRDSRLFRFVHVIAVVVDVVVGIVGRTEQRTPFVFGTRHDFPIAAGSPTFAICHEMNKDLMEVCLNFPQKRESIQSSADETLSAHESTTNCLQSNDPDDQDHLMLIQLQQDSPHGSY
jgi:hypothetical protein